MVTKNDVGTALLKTLERVLEKAQRDLCVCKHEHSAHVYDPEDGGRSPPKKCSVSGCNCDAYKSKRNEREKARESRFQDYLERERKRV